MAAKRLLDDGVFDGVGGWELQTLLHGLHGYMGYMVTWVTWLHGLDGSMSCMVT